jgi:hypothetical protein
MNGYKIVRFLSADPYTARYFKGLAMRDTDSLPGLKEKIEKNVNKGPFLYILNTDVETGRGQHWCVAYITQIGGRCDFFDPFGLPPSFYGFERLLYKYCSYIVYSNKCVQGILSHACSHHCLLFSFYICRGYSMSSILSLYSDDDMHYNEKFVEGFVLQFGKEYKLEYKK